MKHAGLAIENDGVSGESLGLKVGTGLQFLKVSADAIKVLRFGELGDSDREGDTVKVGFGGERCGAANVDDAFRVLLGFEEGECGSGFLLAGEWGSGVRV